jgi:hypothetical protein
MALERIGRSAFGQERPFEEQAESSHSTALPAEVTHSSF